MGKAAVMLLSVVLFTAGATIVLATAVSAVQT
ncbi:MAG: hypothetical protein JWP76_3456, partial [Dactylosporangium sp.]|nr:hypothetical protein [Dactylosporangium sp.]